MLLKNVTIQNICQHELLYHEFSPGLIGVLGRCGSGKSNYIQAIKASLTNNWGWAGTVKEAKVRRGSDSDEAAYVETNWQLDGTDMRLMRSLRPFANEMVFGDQELTRATQISEMLFSMLGLNQFVVDNYVFVDQWEIFRFLKQRAAERIDNFAHLCGVHHAEDVWKYLGKQISEDQSLAAFDYATMTHVQDQMEAAEASVEVSNAKLKELRKKLIPKSKLQAVRDAVEHYDCRQQGEKLLQEQADNMKRVKGQIAPIQKQLDEMTPEIEGMKQQLADGKSDYRNALVQLSN